MGRLMVARVVKRDDANIVPAEETWYDYTVAGSRDWMLLDNNANTTYTYNALNRLTEVAHVNSLSEQIANYAYSIAADGMRTSVTEFLKMPSGMSEPNETRTVDYTYDNLNRLVGEDANDSTDTYGYLISYTYDIVGNRTQRSVDCNSKSLIMGKNIEKEASISAQTGAT